MAKPLLPDALWERIKPLLPKPKPRRFRYPGRKPVDDRKALIGILFILKAGIPCELLPQEMGCLKAGIPCELLPQEMGCGSGMTCWRRLRDWHKAGVWQKLHEILSAELNGADRIDWSRSSVGSRSLRPWGAGRRRGRARLTGGRRGVSTTASSTRTGRLWQRPPPPPMSPTSNNWNR